MTVRSYARVITLVIIFSAWNSAVDADVNQRDEWVVKVIGGPQTASLLAAKSGYNYHGPVLGFKDTYIWFKNDNSNQEESGTLHSMKALNANSEIIRADQQKPLERQKRDYISLADLESEKPLMRDKRPQVNAYGSASNAINSEEENYNDRTRMFFNDELWDRQWYLEESRMSKITLPKLDLNVIPVYRLGITGRGIKIAVLDDGLEHTHDDLRNNYDPSISYDLNEGDDDPLPRYNGENGHGTMCAGEIAMEANNRKCGVGIAYDASIGGIKLLDGSVNDRIEAEAFGYKSDLIDIYSASWGPPDTGTTVDGPGVLAAEALERGVTEGRNGKGSIYVWASGNGGFKSDDCGCDGYVGSIYTIAVASATQTGKFPPYGEKCPAILTTTYSSGMDCEEKIVTTNLNNACTTEHTGTSASAPLAAGIVALALQINGNLTWRDVQHLIVWTSEYAPLSHNLDWIKNAAGFWYNTRFGFGLMNAKAMVIESAFWVPVPEKIICKVDNGKMRPPFNPVPKLLDVVSIEHATTSFFREKRKIETRQRIVKIDEDATRSPRFIRWDDENRKNKTIASGTSSLKLGHKKIATLLQFKVDSECKIMFLEHVEVEVNLKHSRRGALRIMLISPSETFIDILNPRWHDESTDGFENWKFMSVATWGENPQGKWNVLFDTMSHSENIGTIGPFTLILHGTEQMPYRNTFGPRIYKVNNHEDKETF